MHAKPSDPSPACDEVLVKIDDHVDGLLPAPEAEAIRDHLDVCADCRDTALATRAATASLATWGDIEPPEGAFDAILAKIDALPADVLERIPAPAPKRVPFRLDGEGATRTRRFATTGLAAAAAVLAALVIAKSEPRTSRRPVTAAVPSMPVAASGAASDRAGFFRNSYLDDGLFRSDGGSPRSLPAVPANLFHQVVPR
jgi:hypothetical protein